MQRRAGVLGGLIGPAALPLAAWAQDRPWDAWGHPMWGMWGAWGIGMLLFMALFWVAVIVGLVAAVRWLVVQGRGERRERSDAALDILRQRYARGEIDREEFESKKRDLG
jgi:putative membrane protein